MTDNQKEQIKALRLDGYGYKKAAQEIGISVDTVKSYCRKNNLTGFMGEVISKKAYCKECGKELVQAIKKKPIKFCSDTCRTSWWRANKSKVQKTKAIKTACEHCGKDFLAYAHENRKYCSHQCYISSRFKVGDSNE